MIAKLLNDILVLLMKKMHYLSKHNPPDINKHR